MIKEFKEFMMRGNVLDLAVAVVIGAAFGKIVDSLVANIIMPLIALIFGNTDFASAWEWNGITYGVFIQSIIDFLIIGLAVFMFIKIVNKATFGAFEEKEVEPEVAEEVLLLREILEELKLQDAKEEQKYLREED